MKLVRYGAKGAEKPGLIDANGQLRDLSGEVEDFRPERMTFDLTDRLSRLDPQRLPAVEGDPRLGPPLARTGHFIAIGLNYADHAAEAGQPIPAVRSPEWRKGGREEAFEAAQVGHFQGTRCTAFREPPRSHGRVPGPSTQVR